MNDETFSLQPFYSNESLPNLKIAGNIARSANQLTITYALLGNLREVIIATQSDLPTRRHQLWEDTCFEFFVGIKDSERYWEFNLSPTENWNVYRFDGYRQGMQEEVAFTTLPFSVHHQSDSLALALNVDLDQIVTPNQALEIAIAAVIKLRDDEVTYWALTHQSTEADFHQRDSFLIML
ncbi:MAG: DOMON-like domain-containing protein [Rhizonema sp. NSF051]|nr:DOMON-like domain-containing protein [Rhizonema sp. NSF051]